MTRAVKQSEHLFTFVKGKVTDSNDLSDVKGGLRNSDNIDVLRDGSARRRRGLDYEPSYSLSSFTLTDSELEFNALSYGRWLDVAGDGETNLLAVQVGTSLYLYSIDTKVVSGQFITTVDLSPFILAGQTANAEKTPLQFASGKGFLFVVGKYIEPAILSYDVATTNVNVSNINILIRDFDGVTDNLAIDARPSSPSPEHEYNLMNQGWIDTADSGVNGLSSGGGGAGIGITTPININLPVKLNP